MSKPLEADKKAVPGGTSERTSRLRRWPWLIVFALLLLIGGPVVWRFRPLNTSERRIVGTWRDELGNEFVFESNRVLRQSPGSPHTWSASGSVLRWQMAPGFPRSWAAARIYWDTVINPEDWSTGVSFEFDDRGRLHLLPSNDRRVDEYWERVQ